MTRFKICAALLVACCVTPRANGITIDTVPIGNPGNGMDTYQLFNSTRTAGAVDHPYRIGKTEVTNTQYAAFLNGTDPTGANAFALYNNSMSTDVLGGITQNLANAAGQKYEVKAGHENNPVVYVSWFDALRFVNWLENGQGSSDFQNGSYTLLGGTVQPAFWDSIARNPGAHWFLPNEDEWHKAAFHKNDGATNHYWSYATSHDARPYSDEPPGDDAPDQSNTANYFNTDGVANGYNDGYAVTGVNPRQSGVNYLTDVGAYAQSVSPYGTFDQDGNVWEWVETPNNANGVQRRLRGGAFEDATGGKVVTIASPQTESFAFGFRVGVNVPEPVSATMAVIVGAAMLAVSRNSRSG